MEQTIDQTTTQNDLARATTALEVKGKIQTVLMNYYAGEQPLQYVGEYLRKTFAGLRTTFLQNWCSVVINSALDRIDLRGVEIASAQAQAACDIIWDEQRVSLTSDDVHQNVLVAGEGYVAVWPDEAGKAEIYSHDPRYCYVHYDPERPRQPLWAAKKWLDDEGHVRLNLYYPDSIEYYRSRQKASSITDLYKSLEPYGEGVADNPFGIVPIWQFKARHNSKPDLVDVIPQQDAINKLFTDLMIVSEYGAFPQRWISSASEVGELKNAPNEVWDLDIDSRVGEFSAADLGQYLDTVRGLVQTIAAISRTPGHLFLDSAGTQISGEALIALEAPLNKRCEDYIEALIPTWREVFSFALRIEGYDVPERYIMPHFANPATVQPRTAADITATRVASGVPLISALRMEGIDAAEIDRIIEERDEERAAERSNAVPIGNIAALAPEPDAIAGEE